MRDTTADGLSDLLTTATRRAAAANAAWSDLRTAGDNHLIEAADTLHDHAQAAVDYIDRIGCAFRSLAADLRTRPVGRRGLTGFNRTFPDLSTPLDRIRLPLLIDATNGGAFHDDGSYSFSAQYITATVSLTPAATDQLAGAVREAHD